MQAWAGFAAALAVMFAAQVGKGTFSNWLDQKRAERQLEIAEAVQSLAHRTKTAFAAIRHPMHSADELSEAELVLKDTYPGFERKSDGDKQQLKTAQVIFGRHNKSKDLWDSLDEILAPAEAYFDNEVATALQTLIQLRRRIVTSAMMYSRIGVNRTPAQIEQIEAAIWDGFADNDPIAEGVEQCIATIKRNTAPILKGTKA